MKPKPYSSLSFNNSLTKTPLFVVLLIAGSTSMASPAFCEDAKASDKVELKLQTPDPKTPMEHNNRAVELGSHGLWDRAIAEHATAVTKEPENPTFRMNLSSACLHYGDKLAAEKQFDEAILKYRKALVADPNNKPAKAHLDAALLEVQKAKRPGDSFEKATEAEGKPTEKEKPNAKIKSK